MNCMNCEKCQYSTTNKQNYERHLQSKGHLKEKISEYHCEKCQYTTTNKQNYERHLESKSHLEEKLNNYHCEKCQYTTTNKQNYERHLESKGHLEDKIVIKCHIEKIKKVKFESKLCPCCNIQLSTLKQYTEHKESFKHKKNLSTYKSKEVPTAPTLPPKVDLTIPFHCTFYPTPEIINQLNLPYEGQIRMYARKVEDGYKAGVLLMKDKTHIPLGILTKEKLKELVINPRFSNDDDEFGCHHILEYINA